MKSIFLCADYKDEGMESSLRRNWRRAMSDLVHTQIDVTSPSGQTFANPFGLCD